MGQCVRITKNRPQPGICVNTAVGIIKFINIQGHICEIKKIVSKTNMRLKHLVENWVIPMLLMQINDLLIV